MKKILLVMIIILFSAVSIFCGEFEDTLKKAEQGNALAQFNLGHKYLEGQGVPKNYKFSYAWASLAAAEGHKGATQNRDDIAKLLSTQQLAEAQDLAAQIQYKVDHPTESQKQEPSIANTEKKINGSFTIRTE